MSNTRTAKPKLADKPAGIALNLDTLEREGERPVVYAFVHKGRRYEMADPLDLTLEDLDAMLESVATKDVRIAFRACMEAEDAEAFLAAQCPMWKAIALQESYFQHYGIDVAALHRLAGNAGASPG